MTEFSLVSYLAAFHDVEGWFSFDAAILFSIYSQLLSEQQGPGGDTLEIGVHHGLSAIAIAGLRGRNQSFTAIDLFDELQSQNVSQSGEGNRALFERNLARFYEDTGFVYTVTGASGILQTEQLGSDYTFCHIDGGHSRAETYGDLALCWGASRSGGLIAVDDYFNPLFPGVCEGVAQFMLNRPGALVPLAVGYNKVLFQKTEVHESLNETLAAKFPFISAKTVQMWDSPALLFEDGLRRHFDLKRSTLKHLAPLPERGASVKLQASPEKLRAKSGRNSSIRVAVTNTSNALLPSGVEEFGLSHHLLTADGQTLVHDNERTWLTEALGPGESLTVQAQVPIPEKPGRYLLAFDLVWEGVMWFQEAGNAPAYVELEVRR